MEFKNIHVFLTNYAERRTSLPLMRTTAPEHTPAKRIACSAPDSKRKVASFLLKAQATATAAKFRYPSKYLVVPFVAAVCLSRGSHLGLAACGLPRIPDMTKRKSPLSSRLCGLLRTS